MKSAAEELLREDKFPILKGRGKSGSICNSIQKERGESFLEEIATSKGGPVVV